MSTEAFEALEIDHATLGHAYGQVAGRISRQGGVVAEARLAYQRARHERERQEAMLYQLAKAALESARGEGERAPTERAIEAHLRTDAVLSARLLAACEAEWVAEAAFEAARSDYKAVTTEADMVAEAARDRREELRKLDPTLRLPLPEAPGYQLPSASKFGEPVARDRDGNELCVNLSGELYKKGHGEAGADAPPVEPPRRRREPA